MKNLRTIAAVVTVVVPCATAVAAQEVAGLLTQNSSSTEETVASDAVAQSTGSMESDKESIQEVVVTAQKREERLKEVPIYISVLGGDKLDKSTDEGVAEALSRVAGVAVSVNAQGGGPQIAVRGVAAPNALFLGSSPIGYYLDSVPFAFVRSAITPDASAYDLERVEVLRGPQGTLYGASAQNGVVRILTKDADLNTFEFKARGSASGATWGQGSYGGDVAANVPIVEGKLAARTVIGYQDMSGWIDKPNKSDVNNSQLLNVRLKMNAQPTENLKIGLSTWRSRSDFGAPMASDGNHQRLSVDEPIDTEYSAHGVKIGYDFPGVSVSSSTSYIDYSTDSGLDLASLGLANSILVTNLDAEVFAQEFNLNSTNSGEWRWSLGAMCRNAKDGFLQDRRSYAGARRTDQYVTPADVRFGSKSYAAFGELTRLLFNRRLGLTGGLRYFNDDIRLDERSRLNGAPASQLIDRENNFDAVSPRAVITWHLNPEMTIFSSYSEGFRSGAHQLPTVLAAAPDLPTAKPDTLKNYEVGVKGIAFDGRVNFDTSVYFIDWQRVQQPITVQVNSSFFQAALINGSSASGMGFDFGITTKPTTGLTVDLDFSINDLKQHADVISRNVVLFRKGDRLNLSPKYTAGLAMNYVFPLGGTGLEGQISLSGNYTAERTSRLLSGTTVLLGTGDSLFEGNAKLSIAAEERWTASLFADNVTNEYGIVARNVSFPSGINDARIRPRTIGVQVEYRLR